MKKFGFGCMRLPMKDGEVDIPETKKMVDAFLDAGFNYFDTAHGYIQGRSEKGKNVWPAVIRGIGIFWRTNWRVIFSRQKRISARSLRASWKRAE